METRRRRSLTESKRAMSRFFVWVAAVCPAAFAHGGAEIWAWVEIGKCSNMNAQKAKLRNGASRIGFGQKMVLSAWRAETDRAMALPGLHSPEKPCSGPFGDFLESTDDAKVGAYKHRTSSVHFATTLVPGFVEQARF